MKNKNILRNLKIRWLITFLLLNACVDRIDFNVPPAQFQLVIEGMISDAPGPYIVKISQALSLDTDSSYRPPVQEAQVKLYDDEGNVEDLTETSPGVYMTGGLIQGQIGHDYHIRLETNDGNIFESEPDRINPGGEVESIRYSYEARTVQKTYGKIPADIFNIYVDANAGSGDENYVRWRFKGTFQVTTQPELRTLWLQGENRFKDPPPCSGYIVAPAMGGGNLEKVTDCTCCTCWINQFESVPHLSDVQLVSDNEFRNIKVAEVPISNFTFGEKYLVQIEQMSLSKKSFEFFKLIRAQKEGAASLFQPPSGEIKGNIRSMNSTRAVVGIFWATSISQKSLFIPKSEVPYLLPPLEFPNACTNLKNSSNSKPEFWE
jgi:hypothetical protein